MSDEQKQTQWTVSELREFLYGEPGDAVVFAIYHDDHGNFTERPLYKNCTAADDTEHYLYLGVKRTKQK